MKLLDLIHDTKMQAYLAFYIVSLGFLTIDYIRPTGDVNNQVFDLMFLIVGYYYGSKKQSTEI